MSVCGVRLPRTEKRRHDGLLTHRTVLAGVAAQAEMLDFTADDRTLLGVGIDHAVALLPHHLLPMAFGVEQVHTTPKNLAADPLRMLRLVERYRVTVGFFPNFFCARSSTPSAPPAPTSPSTCGACGC